MISSLSIPIFGDWASFYAWFSQLFSSSLYAAARDFLPHILVAMLLGAFLGFERRLKHKVAGVRTHMTVAAASSLITLCGLYMAQQSGVNADPTRLAGQILSGLGFIGAGVILRRGFNTSGVTTAATILFASGVGMACGFGFFALATVSSIFMVAALYFTYRLLPSQETGGHTLGVTCTRIKYEEIKKLFGEKVKVDNITKHGDNVEFRIHTELTSDQVDALLSDLMDNDDVSSVVLIDEPGTTE